MHALSTVRNLRRGDVFDNLLRGCRYRRLLSYVPGAIGRLLTPQTTEGESLASELRQVTVVFVNLGLKNHDLLGAAKYDDAMNRCHQVISCIELSFLCEMHLRGQC